MDRHEDDLVVRHPPDDLDDVLGVLGGEAAGRFVEEVDVGRADHVEADIEALALTAAENLAVGIADDFPAALVEAELGDLAVDASLAFTARKVRRADRRGKLQVFLDRELFVEGVVLRDVGDVLEESLEVAVERALVEQHLAGDRLELAGQGTQQGALSTTTRSHDADHFTALDREGEVVEGGVTAAEAGDEIADIQRADDITLFLDDAVGEVAPKHLAGIDPDGVAILKVHGAPNGDVPHYDRTVGLQHLDSTLLLLVVAGDPKGHFTADTGGDEDVIVIKSVGIVGSDIFRLGALQLEASPEGADAPLEFLEVELAAVAEKNLVGELGVDGRSLPKLGAA